MRAVLLIVSVLLGTAAASAGEEPSGCDKFKWPIEREHAALTSPDRVRLASDSELAALPASAMTISLLTPAEARLPMPPQHAPKDGTYAGFARFKSAPKPGLYTVSLSAGAWVDLIQDGHALTPGGFSGATNCDGIRKTMKYEIAAGPFVLEISGAKDDSLSVAILPAE